ncbi:2,3,4,5-tetrahydropyridine-2,6-dicarboxylate N-acetyltransferase [anaerobic digester metagenome]|jgi:acetyltransferase-like isoleucine patch superfamily enzyme|nr:MAG: N-acetyltransferase [Methanobacteriales archaeon HGW-Methanobacteriales-2]
MSLFKNPWGSSEKVNFKNLFFGVDERDPDRPKVHENVTLGVSYKFRSKPPQIGKNALLRSNTVIYNDVEIGNDFQTGHGVLVREKTKIGDKVLLGTNTVIEGHCDIGSNISIQSNVYIPKNSVIEDYVFLGPCSCFTNDRYPLRSDQKLEGPIIRTGASIGANSTFLSGIEVGEGTMVAAGAIVTRDIPPYCLAIGAPAKHKPLPKHFKKLNKI